MVRRRKTRKVRSMMRVGGHWVAKPKKRKRRARPRKFLGEASRTTELMKRKRAGGSGKTQRVRGYYRRPKKRKSLY